MQFTSNSGTPRTPPEAGIQGAPSEGPRGEGSIPAPGPPPQVNIASTVHQSKKRYLSPAMVRYLREPPGDGGSAYYLRQLPDIRNNSLS